MFNCYVHGWSSHQYMCPACDQQNLSTSGGASTTITLNPEPIKKETPQEFFQFILDNAEKAKENLEMDSFINEVSRRVKALLEQK